MSSLKNKEIASSNMSKSKQIDDLTPEEIKDIDEFYKSKDRKTSSIEEFIQELQNS